MIARSGYAAAARYGWGCEHTGGGIFVATYSEPGSCVWASGAGGSTLMDGKPVMLGACERTEQHSEGEGVRYFEVTWAAFVAVPASEWSRWLMGRAEACECLAPDGGECRACGIGVGRCSCEACANVCASCGEPFEDGAIRHDWGDCGPGVLDLCGWCDAVAAGQCSPELAYEARRAVAS